MQVFFVLLLIALIAAGYYVYQRLLAIEREIRADQRALAEKDQNLSPPVTETKAEPPPPVTVKAENPVAEESLAVTLMQRIRKTPGLAQPEVYQIFPDVDRRELQKLLRELEQHGQVRREKKGSSFLLYPA